MTNSASNSSCEAEVLHPRAGAGAGPEALIPSQGLAVCPFSFETGGGAPPKYSFRNPESIFAEFMRSSGAGGDEDLNDILFSSFGSGKSSGGRSARMRSSFGADPMQNARHPTPEVTTVERPLPLALEDLFTGVTKKMKIKRKTYDDSGKRTTTDTVLEVPIKPGLKKGSKIRFKGVGDQEEGGQQDLVFIVEEVSVRPCCAVPASLATAEG
jgi:DnaJ family protein B protein 4